MGKTRPMRQPSERFARVPEFVAEAFPDLSHSAVRVYVALAAHKDWRTNEVSASYPTIAKWAGVNRKSVHKAINELSEVRALSWQAGKKGRANRFYIPNEPKAAPTDGIISDRAESQSLVLGSPKDFPQAVPTDGTHYKKESLLQEESDPYFEELKRRSRLNGYY